MNLTPLDREGLTLYRKCILFGRDTCELCGVKPRWLPLAAHHPLGRGVVYRMDLRNGIVVCPICHAAFDHNLDELLAAMRRRGMHEQADWLEARRHRVHPQARVDREKIVAELRDALAQIRTGLATVDDFRDYGSD